MNFEQRWNFKIVQVYLFKCTYFCNKIIIKSFVKQTWFIIMIMTVKLSLMNEILRRTAEKITKWHAINEGYAWAQADPIHWWTHHFVTFCFFALPQIIKITIPRKAKKKKKNYDTQIWWVKLLIFSFFLYGGWNAWHILVFWIFK